MYKVLSLLVLLIALFFPGINSYAAPLKESLPGDIIIRDTGGEMAREWEIAFKRGTSQTYRGGHAGVYAGDGFVYDVMPQDKKTGFPGGMRYVAVDEFLKPSKNYYTVTPKAYDIGDNYLKRFQILSDLENLRKSGLVVFDENHSCQKCVEYNPDGTVAKYIFDCVGLVEDVFEKNGIDVVPANMETFQLTTENPNIPGTEIILWERRALTPSDYLISPNVRVSSKYPTQPGGGNPDDFAGVLASNSAFISGNKANGRIGVLANGFFVGMMKLIGGGSLIQPDTLLDSKDYPVLIIPSGGLYGLDGSDVFKANIEQYISNGGTVVVLSQQHGYEFNALPTPDGKPITGYGWEEIKIVLPTLFI